MENTKQKKEYDVAFKSIYIMFNKSYIERKESVSPSYRGNIVIDAKDSVEVENCDKEGFVLKFTRTAELKPKVVFLAKVEYMCHFLFDTATKKFFGNDIEKIKLFAEDKKQEAVDITNVTNRASMLIAFLTYQINSTPVITPPDLIVDTE